jgi:hypothetical protein
MQSGGYDDPSDLLQISLQSSNSQLNNGYWVRIPPPPRFVLSSDSMENQTMDIDGLSGVQLCLDDDDNDDAWVMRPSILAMENYTCLRLFLMLLRRRRCP